MNSRDAIIVKNLKKSYPGVLAVDDISFQVGNGEIYGLLGPNGAGKTTTLRLLAGMMKADSGEILVCGKRVDDSATLLKQKIGFLSNDTRLYERLTTRETLRFFGKLQGLEKHRLEENCMQLIRRLEMEDFADRLVGTLSSGQQQRANIARALVHDPEVLIFDEVTASLDILRSRFIIEMIREAKDQGKAVIFSTHIMSEAEYLCDRIAFIHEGHIIREGSKSDLLAAHGCDNLTDAFIRDIDELKTRDKREELESS